MKRNLAFLLIGIFITLLLSACSSSNNEEYTQTKILMDTPIKLTAYGRNADKAVEESFKRLDEIEKMASTVISTSDVAKINNSSGKEYVKVHPEIIKMIENSINYSKLSDGAFDITIGPIINLWGIGTENARVPSESELKSKLSLVGYEKISINKEENSVLLKEQGMAIELGGIAKGFAVDEVLKIYKKYDIKNGLISLGSSSMYALGKNQAGNPWSIGIRHPRSEDSKNYLGIIKITDEALSTSGDYERFFVKDDKRYHHILNPKTGYPADTGVMSDTIIVSGESEDSNMIADILTTTSFVLGPEKAIRLADNLPNVAVEITTADNKIYTSSGFKDRFANLNEDFKVAN